MKRNIVICAIASLLFIFSSCSVGNTENNETTTGENASREITSEETAAITDEATSHTGEISSDVADTDMFTSGDDNTSPDGTKVSIILNGDSVQSSSDSVNVKNGIITISEEAVYEISGNLSDGMIYINADEKAKINLIFNGVKIYCNDNAPLYIRSCDKVFITLREGTENTVENGGTFSSFDENNIDGAVFSKQDLTFNGSGSLTVTSPADHGIVCKDDLVFTGGNITVNSASHGIQANDSVRIKNTLLDIAAGKDGIHCENEDNPEKGFIYIESGIFNVSAEGDGLSAGTTLNVSGGTFDIITGGGSENAQHKTSSDWGGFMGGRGDKGGMGGMGGSRPSMPSPPTANETYNDSESIKGLKCAGNIDISGGEFSVNSADDSIHSNADISVSGGTFSISSGDDGVHADETLTVTGGTFSISDSYEGLEALDIRLLNGDITLNASDDGLNAAGGTDSSGMGGFRGGDMFGGGMSAGNGSIVISGGTLTITASGDGIDANGSLTVDGGYTVVTGPTKGDTATLDYDTAAIISGGTFIGTGAAGMAQTFSDGTQGVIAVTVGSQAEGTNIRLADSKGNTLIEYAPELSFGVVILSSPEVVKNEEYTLCIGDAKGTFTAQ